MPVLCKTFKNYNIYKITEVRDIPDLVPTDHTASPEYPGLRPLRVKRSLRNRNPPWSFPHFYIVCHVLLYKLTFKIYFTGAMNGEMNGEKFGEVVKYSPERRKL